MYPNVSNACVPGKREMLPLDHFQVLFPPAIPIPKPITESPELQSSWLLPAIPIRNFKLRGENFPLKPSLLHFSWKRTLFMSDNHSALPAFVAWKVLFTITLYSDVAV